MLYKNVRNKRTKLIIELSSHNVHKELDQHLIVIICCFIQTYIFLKNVSTKGNYHSLLVKQEKHIHVNTYISPFCAIPLFNLNAQLQAQKMFIPLSIFYFIFRTNFILNSFSSSLFLFLMKKCSN
ncbi:hypothetical protein EGW08_011696 [Elysia chlorotica]|uniref:Transmembrane protein n=1 Tax=Elysia chlorotica TaxID=188477 RepID=A0A3S1HJ93_ELYCH|nr:hypothetical protein EGW08_011696 [Elysia chlorotica]